MTIHFYTPPEPAKNRLEFFQFPGGELHLRAGSEGAPPSLAVVVGTDPKDLLKLALWADYVRVHDLTPRAFVPYLPAARADRGAPFGAKVYADFINVAGLSEIVVFDPHSEVGPALVNKVRVVTPTRVILDTVLSQKRVGEFAGVIAPDEGAVGRAKAVADAAGLPLYRAKKQRDFDTGKILGLTVDALPDEGKLLVVDDICDGGGTFKLLAAKTNLPPERLELWVSHGIFSGTAHELQDHYSTIWTTNSHPAAANSVAPQHVINILPYLYEGDPYHD